MPHAFQSLVPQKLRDMLNDYPEHIEYLQAALNRVAEKQGKGLPMIEQAIWILEDGLGAFTMDAHEELSAAEAGGDTEAIERARSKALAFGYARANMGTMPDLDTYSNAWRP